MWADIEKDNVIYTIINVHLINDIIGTIKGFLTGRFFYKGGYLREKQISTLIRHLEEVFKKRNIIVAGDFNSVPPGFEQRFTDRFHGIEEEDDYKGDNTMSILMRYCEKTKTLLWPFKEKNRDEIPKFNTYPSLEPKRPLDYIFFPFNNSYNVIKALVSDHLPVMCEGVKE
jgi:endonuclease/exonuclease/phosphatase family metal-dependent hydrolase